MSTKIHPVLVHGIMDILKEVLFEGRYADKAIENKMKLNKKWGARDRAFIAESVYEIIRYLSWFEYVADVDKDTLPGNYTRAIFRVYWWRRYRELPSFPESPTYAIEELQSRSKAADENVALKYSFPEWLVKAFEKDHGDRSIELLRRLNVLADVVLRTNTLKGEVEDLRLLLEKEGVATKRIDDSNALKLVQRQNVFRTEAFKKGLFEVQDYASQQVSEFLDLKPGMQMVDACAGAGGKTLHMAALSQGKGRILAMDTETYKLEELRKRCKRAGAGNVETRHIENNKQIKRLTERADRLLLDVPCSGTGVIRRNPDTKWKIQEAEIETIVERQKKIIQDYSRMLKPGGKLVYATCSILNAENKEVVDWFLNSNPDFELEAERNLLPDDFGYDGFYMARLRKLKPVKQVEQKNDN
jgi:16S rRNA (cytosine967-C5)-methyltransferase